MANLRAQILSLAALDGTARQYSRSTVGSLAKLFLLRSASTAWLEFISGCGILKVVDTCLLYRVVHRKCVSHSRFITAGDHRITSPACFLEALLRQTSYPRALALWVRIVVGATNGLTTTRLSNRPIIVFPLCSSGTALGE
jgi:hypothetical protein